MSSMIKNSKPIYAVKSGREVMRLERWRRLGHMGLA